MTWTEMSGWRGRGRRGGGADATACKGRQRGDIFQAARCHVFLGYLYSKLQPWGCERSWYRSDVPGVHVVLKGEL